MKQETIDNWTIDFRTGMLKKDGKNTGVSFVEVATSPEMREFIRNEIDKEIIAELMKEKK